MAILDFILGFQGGGMNLTPLKFHSAQQLFSTNFEIFLRIPDKKNGHNLNSGIRNRLTVYFNNRWLINRV